MALGRVTVAWWVLLALLGAANPAAATHESGAAGHCERSGSVTVKVTDQVRVYKRRRDRRPSGARVESTYACLIADGRTIRLDNPRAVASFTYPPPGLAIAGTVVAYGIDVVGEGDASDQTRIEVVDLAAADPPTPQATFDAYRPGPAHVGSVVATPSGGVAWIGCPQTSGISQGSAAPNCKKPGRSLKRVFKVDAGTGDVVALDRGRTIDPRSLRVRGGEVTWRKGRSSRSAPLG